MSQGQLLGVTIIAVLGWTLIGHGVNLPEQLIDAVYALMLATYTFLYEALRDRTRSTSERVRAFVTGDVYINPWIATLFVIGALEFVERVSGGLLGAAISMGLGQVDQGKAADAVIMRTSPFFVELILVLMIIPIAKYAAHRIRKFPFLWITGAIAVSELITLAVPSILFQLQVTPTTILYQTVAGLLQLPGAALGCLWAKKTQMAYGMSRLFSQLPRSDQEAIIDLMQMPPRPQTPGAAPGPDVGAPQSGQNLGNVSLAKPRSSAAEIPP